METIVEQQTKKTNRYSCEPISAMNAKTGEIKKFNSITEASVFLNLTAAGVVKALSKKDRNRPTRGYVLRRANSESLPILNQINFTRNGKSVSIMDVKTREIITLPTLTEAGKFLNLTVSGVSRILDYTPKNKATRGGYILRRGDDPTPWPTPDQIIKRGNSLNKDSFVPTIPILIMNAQTREITRFSSVTEVAIYLNMSISGVSKALGKLGDDLNRPTRGYFLKRESDKSPWPESDNIKTISKHTAIKIVMLNIKTRVISRYESVSQATKDLDCAVQTVSRRVHSQLPFKFKDFLIGTEKSFQRYLDLSQEKQIEHLKKC